MSQANGGLFPSAHNGHMTNELRDRLVETWTDILVADFYRRHGGADGPLGQLVDRAIVPALLGRLAAEHRGDALARYLRAMGARTL